MNLYQLFRPLIYRLTPEQAHALTIRLLQLAGSNPISLFLMQYCFQAHQPGPARVVAGLTFPNPLGMAAGYDKDGLGWRGLVCLGFGHIELGTVTPLAQPGNPSPRVFRLVKDQAVINRMGFPGRGAAFLARRLRGSRPKNLVLGVNIGKNKVTPLETTEADYVSLVQTFAPLADYLAVNVSSPNTPGLRTLQSRQALSRILQPVNAARLIEVAKKKRPIPIFVKLAPDLDDRDLDEALQSILENGMDGVIAANTTLQRISLTSPLASEEGGLSGTPIGPLSQAFLEKVVRRLDGRLPVIASGGVMNAPDAQSRLDAGADLVQLYTGLIFSGPGLVKDILDAGLVFKGR
jgi:dihydroorotate dehydrogenase